jgi:hypothetical protein
VLMSQIILKVGEPKIISAQGSEQNILMWLFLLKSHLVNKLVTLPGE